MHFRHPARQHLDSVFPLLLLTLLIFNPLTASPTLPNPQSQPTLSLPLPHSYTTPSTSSLVHPAVDRRATRTTAHPLEGGWTMYLQTYDTVVPALLPMATYSMAAFYAHMRVMVLTKWSVWMNEMEQFVIGRYVDFPFFPL